MSLKKTLNRFMKFAGSSIVGGTVDMFLVWVLSSFIFSGYWGDVIISPIIAFECSVLVNFVFSWFFIWNDRITPESKGSFVRSLLVYNVSNIGVFAIRMILVVIIEKTVGGNLVIINLVSRLLAGLLNFVISDKLIFKAKR